MSRVLFVSSLALTVAGCGGLAQKEKDASPAEAAPEESLSESELREGLDEPACLSLSGTEDSQAPLDDLQPTNAVFYFAYRRIGNHFDSEWGVEFVRKIAEAEAELRAAGELSSEELDEALSDLFDPYVFTINALGDCTLAQGCDRYVVPEAEGFDDGPFAAKGHYFAWGPGGARLITDVDQLHSFLGTIDTPLEAALLAQHSGYPVPCAELGGDTTPEGFVLYSEKREFCSDERVGRRLLVTRDGEMEVLASTVLDEGIEGCVE